ncbi:MAG: hypothetical protein ACYDHH_15985 [Solirubrobacteraceae bacterium]
MIDVDGTIVQFEETAGPDGAAILTGWLGRAARASTVEVGVATPVTQPCSLDPESTDDHLLGVAISEIELTRRRSDVTAGGDRDAETGG